MKKLLSILSISCIAGSTSSSVVSCASSTKTPTSKKTDISTIAIGQENYGNTYGSIYESVREQLADAAKISPYTIKDGTEKNNVLISITKEEKPGQWVEVAENDSTIIDDYTATKVLKVSVEVNDKSAYFKSTDNKYVQLNMSYGQVDILSVFNKTLPIIPEGLKLDKIQELITAKLGRLTNEEKLTISFKVRKDGKDLDKNYAVKKGDKLSVIFPNQNGDPFFAPIDIKGPSKAITLDITVSSKAKELSKDSVKLSSDVIVAGMSYDSVYGIVRNQIAALKGINPLVIKDGVDKDNVLLSLIVNGNAVVDGTIAAGDNVSFKYQVTENSVYYAKTPLTEIAKPITVAKVSVSDSVLSGLTFKVGDEYTNIYNAVRERLAQAAGIDTSVIKADDSIKISLFIDNKPINDSADKIDKTLLNKEVLLKLQVDKANKYFAEMPITSFKLSTIEKATK